MIHSDIYPVKYHINQSPFFQAGDYVLVQLILNRPAEDSKQKLLAPGLIVKSPDHPTDISFIILLFTGEKLIASRHDLIKVRPDVSAPLISPIL